MTPVLGSVSPRGHSANLPVTFVGAVHYRSYEVTVSITLSCC
jgi:hypothetical protein